MKKGQGKIYDSYYANFIGDTNNFLYSFNFFFSFCILKREHKIKKGDLVLLVGFGGGLAYASTLIKWTL